MKESLLECVKELKQLVKESLEDNAITEEEDGMSLLTILTSVKDR